MKIKRVVIIESDKDLNGLLVHLVQGKEDLLLINSFTDAKSALLRIDLDEPDVMICGLACTEIDGLNYIPKFHRKCNDLGVIMLADFTDGYFLQQALKSGVSGFLLRQSSAMEIEEALNTISKGGGFFNSRIAKRYIDFFRKRISTPLTRREVEIVNSLAIGNTYKMVANDLKIARGTVKVHVSNIYEKLGARNRAEAITRARDYKLIASLI